MAYLYGWYLGAAYLLKSPRLTQPERDSVREWLGNCDRYFAMADVGILCDAWQRSPSPARGLSLIGSDIWRHGE